MAKINVEIIIGEKPTEPVDPKKVIKSTEAFPTPEPEVKAYHGRGGAVAAGFLGGLIAGAIANSSPPPAVVVATCPYCGAVAQLAPVYGRVAVGCWHCGQTYWVSM